MNRFTFTAVLMFIIHKHVFNYYNTIVIIINHYNNVSHYLPSTCGKYTYKMVFPS